MSLWFPNWATDLSLRRLRSACAARGERARPLAHALLTDRVGAQEVVMRRCARCASLGVREGMSLAHARSRLPEGATPHVERFDAARDGASLRALAQWALRYSPIVAPDGEDGLALDITGTERLHAGENRQLRTALGAMGAMGLRVRGAVAPSLGCARAMARGAANPASIVRAGGEREALSPLSIRALGLESATLDALHEVGVRTIGQALALRRTSIARRFEGALARLDGALSRAPEAIDPVRPPDPLIERIDFDGPSDHAESVWAAAEAALERVIAGLARREQGARRLRVRIERPMSPVETLEISLSRPSRAPRHLRALLRTRMERVDMAPGVDGVSVAVVAGARLAHAQRAHMALGGTREEAAASAPWAEFVDAALARLGPGAALRAEIVESHLPERAFLWLPAGGAGRGDGRASGCVARRTPNDRPWALLPRPEEARVVALTPDGPALRVRWRGEDERVAACAGPERIGAEWWRSHEGATPPDRDYFVVQTESGRRLWLCRHGADGRWLVHGEWA